VEDAGLERPGVLDMANHLVEKASFSDGRDRDEERARSVDRSADHRIAVALLDGNGLACHQRLVDAGMAADHRAVGRMRSPGRIRTRSPTLTSSIGTSTSWASRTTRAVSGCKSSRRFTAWELRVLTMSDSHSEKMW
jgi:hypothetical protein